MTLDRDRGGRLEGLVARVLGAVTYVGIACIGLGTALMVARGVSPLAAPPSLSPAAVLAALAAGRPEGPIGIGIAILAAGPVLRVASALVGFGASGERRMAAVALGILVVIGVSVLVSLAGSA